MTDEAHIDQVDQAGGTTAADRRQIAITPLAAMTASAVALVCSFLPWARVFLFTVNGTDGDGMVTAVGSGAALVLLYSLSRATTRRSLLAALAVLGAAVSAGTYGYDLARISRMFNSDEMTDSLFGDTVSVGFALVLGAAASGAALVATLVHALHVRRSGEATSHSGWGPHHLAVSMLAGATLSLAAAERVWGLAIALALVTGVSWFLSRAKVAARSAVGALASVAVLAGLAGGAFGASRADSAGPVACDDLFADGADVDTIVETDMCNGPEGRTFVFTMDYECYDDSTLYVSDDGWGYSGKTWNTSGEAPVDVCRTDAEEDCSAMFADGVTTDPEWVWSEPECFDPSGVPVSVPTESQYCEDFSSMLWNDYGWGKKDEPWNAGESHPLDC